MMAIILMGIIALNGGTALISLVAALYAIWMVAGPMLG